VSAAEDPVETRSAPPPSLTFGILACREPQATVIAAWSSVNPTGGGAGPLKRCNIRQRGNAMVGLVAWKSRPRP
jgi:hypothetical protein